MYLGGGPVRGGSTKLSSRRGRTGTGSEGGPAYVPVETNFGPGPKVISASGSIRGLGGSRRVIFLRKFQSTDGDRRRLGLGRGGGPGGGGGT